MRHFYFRFILGIVWLAAAVFSAVSASLLFAALYVVLVLEQGQIRRSFTEREIEAARIREALKE